MSELRLTLCPICKEEILLPFSVSQHEMMGKTFASWICTNCAHARANKDSVVELKRMDAER